MTPRDSHSVRTGQRRCSTCGEKDSEETITSMRNSILWPQEGRRGRGMRVQTIRQSIYAKNAACRETEVTAVGGQTTDLCCSSTNTGKQMMMVVVMMMAVKCRAARLRRHAYTNS